MSFSIIDYFHRYWGILCRINASKEGHALQSPGKLEENAIAKLGYQHAYPAFKDFLDESIVAALKHEHLPLGFLSAIKDGFYIDKKLSKKTIAILSASITIAVIAGYFYVNPSGSAADTIIGILKNNVDYDFPGSDALRYLMQSTSTGENIFVSTYSAILMFQAYANKPSKAVQFLHFHDATLPEKFRNFGRKIFDLICAACANIPTFLLTQKVSVPMAVLTALANMCLSWKGVSNFDFRLTMLPVRRELIKYLDTQTNYFLTSTDEQKKIILDHLINITNEKNHQKLFYYLLNLGEPVYVKNDNQTLYLQQPYSRPAYAYIVPTFTGAMGILAELSFISATAFYIPQLFDDPSSIASMATTSALVAFSLLPAFGFGGKGGFNAGLDATSRTPLLPHYGMPITHSLSQWGIRLLTLFSGGATFAVAHDTTESFAVAQQFSTLVKDVCKYIFAGTAYVGSAIMNGYYTSCLLDEIKIYFGLRCGNQKTNQLFNFTLAVRQLQSLLKSMTDESLIDCLQNQMLISDTATDDDIALSNLLYGIFYHGLSEKEYQQFQKEIEHCSKHESTQKTLKDRSMITPPQVVQRFYPKKTAQDNVPKTAWCFGIFNKKPGAPKKDTSLTELPQWTDFKAT